MYSIGVDIGGTKVAAAIISSTGKNKIIYKIKEETDTSTRENLFSQVHQLIQQLIEKSKIGNLNICGIGLGVPGKVDVARGIAISQNNIPWDNFSVIKRLKERYPSLNIMIDNDVCVAAIAEKNEVDTIESNKIFTYMTISTGLGSTSLIGDKIIRGDGFAGEIGFFPSSNTDSKIERLEPSITGKGIAMDGSKLMNKDLSTKQVFEYFNQGNDKINDLIKNKAKKTAEAIYTHVCILNPVTIVLGGSVIVKQPTYFKMIIKELEKLLVKEQQKILSNIKKSNLGSDNGVIGAGLLALQ